MRRLRQELLDTNAIIDTNGEIDAGQKCQKCESAKVLQKASSNSWRPVALCHNLSNGRALCIQSLKHRHIDPPFWYSHLWQGYREENDGRSNNESGIECYHRDVIIRKPPAIESLLNPVVEQQSYTGPNREIQTSCRRQPRHRAQDDWSMEKASQRARVQSSEDVKGRAPSTQKDCSCAYRPPAPSISPG